MTLQDIINKRKEFSSVSTQVTNCIVHAHLPFDERPEDCRLCHADMSSFIRRVLSANEFCNSLLDEVAKVAAEAKPAHWIEAQQKVMTLARKICRKIKDFDEMLKPEDKISTVVGVHTVYRDLEAAFKELDDLF